MPSKESVRIVERGCIRSFQKNKLSLPPFVLESGSPIQESKASNMDRFDRYRPSKNPYWNKLRVLQDLAYCDHETELYPGHWRTRFLDRSASQLENKERKLHVEIGCNAGHLLVEWAKNQPQDVYIGLDWKFKAIYRGVEKAIQRGLKNVLFFRGHAERLPFMFGPQEIDFLDMYFPDPWAKNSQLKNRLITVERLRIFASLMKPNGVFHIKTDHPDYFRWMLKAVAEVSNLWEVIENNPDLYQNHPAPEKLDLPEVTVFERLFIRKKIPIQSLKLRRLRA